MMSGYGANPISFNKKIKIGCPEHSLTSHPLHLITSHFYLTPPPPQSGHHMCITPYLKTCYLMAWIEDSEDKKHFVRCPGFELADLKS